METRRVAKNPIIVPLDKLSYVEMCDAARELHNIPRVWGVKLNDALVEHGVRIVAEFVKSGIPVMADPKFHDIPETVENGVERLRRVGASFITVHISGGRKMLEYAMRAAHRTDGEWSKIPEVEIIGITVLTSLDDVATHEVFHRSVAAEVARLYRIGREMHLDGFVCSAKDLETLETENPLTGLEDDLFSFRNFVGRVITPGIRGPNDSLGEQKRVMTPRAAVEAGASHLVIGRPIMRGEGKPAENVAAIMQTIRDLLP